MKKIVFIVISMIFILQFTSVEAQTGSVLEDKSIKEIKQDIERLHTDRNTLNNQFTVLTQNNNFMLYLVKNDFFRKDISKNDIKNIEILITGYNKNYIRINKKLLDNAKNLEDIYSEKRNLLDLKKDLYQSLIKYVQINKYKEYLNFIKGDAEIIKKNLDVKGALISNKEVLNSKVLKIEEKIQIERRKMSNNIKAAVSKKIDEKIKKISENEKFKKLRPELQIKIIQKTITKVDNILIKMKEKISDESIFSQKIEVYELLNRKLSNYIITLELKK